MIINNNNNNNNNNTKTIMVIVTVKGYITKTVLNAQAQHSMLLEVEEIGFSSSTKIYRLLKIHYNPNHNPILITDKGTPPATFLDVPL
jgi:hypothetical protein